MARAPLTLHLLRTFPFNRYASHSAVQHGRAYYREGRVLEIELLDPGQAVCTVEGDSDTYEVEITTAKTTHKLQFDCDCLQGSAGVFCKHMVAAGLELTDYLAEMEEDELYYEDLDPDLDLYVPPPPSRPSAPLPPPARKWKSQLSQVLGAASRRPASAAQARYIGLVILEPAPYLSYSYGLRAPGSAAYTLTPFVIRAAEWLRMKPGEPAPDRAAILARLETDPSWLRAGQVLTQPALPSHYLNLDARAAEFMNLLRSVRSPFYATWQGHQYLPLLLSELAQLDLPLFKRSTGHNQPKIERRLSVLREPVALAVDLRHAKDGVTLLAGYERGEAFVPIETPALVLSEKPAWVVLGDAVAQLRDGDAPGWLSAFPLDIPARDVEDFREGYLASLAQRVPLRSGVVQWQTVQAPPVPRLYLRDDPRMRLSAEVRFAYGEHEAAPAKRGEPVTLVTLPDSWTLVKIQRDPEREQACLQSLASGDFGLKRADSTQPYGTFWLRARVHPYDFLLHSVPRLAQAGFEVYGEESLKIGKVNRHTPSLRVHITSGIDWFDLKAVVTFGDQQVSLQAVRKALQKGERFVKLADGSVGQIPEDWLAKTRHLWEMATETEDGFRVADTHLPLLDPLLEAAPDIQIPPDLRERRERLRSFERIQPQPMPQHFIGELRPYQRHGVDWLYFLHEYQWGGILADDMGLGKTIQVLAFLQLLKERAGGEKQAAVLLVAPKSLMTNWQREAARFTPGLRVMPYLGAARSKDTALFDDQDVVLTTYGTMLRDIDHLRRYRFHYVILDESQAIKNPLAKSAKAARLLQADHRLVLTGTPVENNSLELWSQFAFLNPGLLGSLDYFRRAFANPIEAHGDQAAAATLRALVYPFILRRTKAQVAPELPPRTERVLYADMDAAQRRLYAQTRARYQAELLNLIESRGLNNARFKVLEGLLRLRQIAIHPALVEPRYKGKAPKLELLLETLDTLHAGGHKVLVFSQFVAMLKLVRQALEAQRLRYIYLDGRTTDRQARVDTFQNDPAYPIFLISLKAGGVGLNLTAADYVIHLDPWWNPAVEMQASDRAHRIGQDKPVFVYKLIARDTVEEKIIQLQEKKRALVESLVTTEAAFFKSLTPDDIQQLFA